MATRLVTRSVLTVTRQILVNAAASTATTTATPSSSLLRLRPLFAAVNNNFHRLVPPPYATRGFATRHTSSSLNDSNPNWSNRPPKETILLDGCDFEHWLVVLEKPEGDPTRDEIIDSYIKTLAQVVGSEEEARMKIYSVSTKHYFAFGALVSEELSHKLKELPRVRWVLPDSYLDVKNKDYGGEPFINGQAVPYDPKYHEEWVRNNARALSRNNRNDRPRNFDRSRNFDRRRGMQNQGPNMAGPGNTGGPSHGPPGHQGPGHNMPGVHQGPGPNMPEGQPGMPGGQPGYMGPPNHGSNMAPRNMGPPPNVRPGPAYNMGGGPPNMGRDGMPPNMGVPQNYGQPSNIGGMPPNLTGPGPNHPQNQYGYIANNNGHYQSGPGPAANSNVHYQSGPGPAANNNGHYQSGPGPTQNSYNLNPQGGNYQHQHQN